MAQKCAVPSGRTQEGTQEVSSAECAGAAARPVDAFAYQKWAVNQVSDKLQIKNLTKTDKVTKSFFHAVGMAEECAELHAASHCEDRSCDSAARANIIKEAGDLCWYLVNWCDCWDVPFGKCVVASINSRALNEDLSPRRHIREDLTPRRLSTKDFVLVHGSLGEILGKQKRVALGKFTEGEFGALVEPLVTEFLIRLQNFLGGHTDEPQDAHLQRGLFLPGRLERRITLCEVFEVNMRKIEDRKARDVVVGEGDNR